MRLNDKIELFEDAAGNIVGLAPENVDTPEGWKRITYRRQRGAGMARNVSEQRVLTPPEFLKAVVARFGQPEIDLAASDGDQIAGVDYWYTPEANSLSADWSNNAYERGQLCWLNPPFGTMRPWVQKCVAYQDRLNILLLCCASDTKWWREYVKPFAYVYKIGRLKFVGHEHPHMKDLALCHYGPGVEPGEEWWPWKPEKVKAAKPKKAKKAKASQEAEAAE